MRKEYFRHVRGAAKDYKGFGDEVAFDDDLNLRIFDGVKPGGYIIGGGASSLRGFASVSDRGINLVNSLANVWTTIPNDGLGSQTDLQRVLPNSLPILNPNHSFNLKPYAVGTGLVCRLDYNVIPTQNNTVTQSRFYFVAKDEHGTPLFDFALPNESLQLNSGAGIPYQRLETTVIYVGDETVRLGDCFIQTLCSSDAKIQVNGWAIWSF